MPSVMEKVKEALSSQQPENTKGPEERVKRGRDRLKEVSGPRKVNIAFANNEHYVSVGKDGTTLNKLSTTPLSQGGEKPDHRVRLSRDLISPIIKAKVSATTQRVPSYESIPTSPDSEDFSASQLAQKIAVGGYDLWRLRRANKKLVWNALVTEEGFIRAYWDPTIGPFIQVDKTEPAEVDVTDPETGEPTGVKRTVDVPTGETEHVGMGEVGIKVYSGLEVGWEPGVDFEESRWFFVEHARPTEDVEREEGFIGGKLDADAQAHEGKTDREKKGSKLVMVTEYLERPCPDYPEGRRLIFANDRIIFPEESYPRRTAQGEIIDEPPFERLSYDIDGSSDRDKGLVRSLIESMRQYDKGANKMLEWVEQTLFPQWEAEEGTLLTPITDEPGAVVEYSVLAGGNKPQVRQPGPVPRELFELQDRSQAELGLIAHDNQIPMQNTESGKQAATFVQKDALAWQDFIEDYAELQGRVMRDCLILVQRHYSEDRLVKFRGRTGWENIADFKGTDLRGQTDIRVGPSSLEPRTRASNEQRIMNIAQMFPGHFPPEVLISALEGGSAEKLIEGYEDDVARANRIISQIRSGEFWSLPPRPVFPGEEGIAFDPNTGQPELGPNGEPMPLLQLPGWMPRPFDNVPVQKAVLELYMKSDDWASLDEAAQRATIHVYNAFLAIEAKKAQRDAELQSQMAMEAGMANATRPGPQGSKPMPSLPALEGGEEAAG